MYCLLIYLSGGFFGYRKKYTVIFYEHGQICRRLLREVSEVEVFYFLLIINIERFL